MTNKELSMKNEFDDKFAYMVANGVFNKHFRWAKHEKEDLIQEGVMRLFERHRDYDITRGTYFTFANMVVWGAMKKYLRKQSKHYQVMSLDAEDIFGNCLVNIVLSESANEHDLQDIILAFDLAKVQFGLSNKEIQMAITKWLNGSIQDEIAKLLDISRFTVSRRIKAFFNAIRDVA